MTWETMADGSIRRRQRSAIDEVDVDDYGLTVRLEAGSGYMQQELDAYVPMADLVALFARRGFTLTRKGE